MKTLGWSFFIFLAIVVGLYPFAYLVVDMSRGFLTSKPAELLGSGMWNAAFYIHVVTGGIALLTGWIQFSKRFRNRHLNTHRLLGKIYLIAILFSGTTGLYIALFANGGVISELGFSGLALSWLFTSLQAYTAIKRKEIDFHQEWMIRSYAVCFAAVTLRIYLPLFQFGLGMDFITGYRIISWLCWVPNLVVAELIIRNIRAGRIVRNTA